MLEDYKDITSRIAEPPKWFDENGTPRYDDFRPDMCPDIHAQEIALMEICCQACGKRFMVEVHHDRLNRGRLGRRSDRIAPGNIPHYGDPPPHGGCSGDTMNCYDLRIVEFWRRLDAVEGWKRVPSLEMIGEQPDESEWAFVPQLPK